MRCTLRIGCLLTVTIALFSAEAVATEYYVDQNQVGASDTNAGTSPSAPWKTIQKAAATMVAGDRVTIASGQYDEEISMTGSGTAAQRITYRAEVGATVQLPRGLTINKDNIVVQGLELPGASLTVDGSYCQILDNYIHHSEVFGVFIHGGYNLLRGNKIANNGSSWGGQVTTGWDNGNEAHHYVLEDNEISDEEGKGEDLMQYMGHDAIIRGNHFHHLGSNGRHNDCYQSGGGEYNIWIVDNRFEQLSDIQYFMIGSGDHDHIWRGNLMWGSIGWGFNGTPANMRVMNNTFSVIGGGWGVAGVGKARNNIFSPPGSDGHGGDVDYSCVDPIPCCSTRGPHDLWGVDPLFEDFDARDFRLKSTSPCINAGTYLTSATRAGSGTALPVADAKVFVDGFGIAPGDQIQLEGQSERANVLQIDYASNVLTLDRSLSWSEGLGVSTPFAGSAPDIGAFEYSSAESVAPASPTNLRLAEPK